MITTWILLDVPPHHFTLMYLISYLPCDFCFIPMLHSYPYYRNDCTMNSRPLCIMSMGFSCQFRPLLYGNILDQLKDPESLKTKFRDRRALDVHKDARFRLVIWKRSLYLFPTTIVLHDHVQVSPNPTNHPLLIHVFFPHNEGQLRVRSGSKSFLSSRHKTCSTLSQPLGTHYRLRVYRPNHHRGQTGNSRKRLL